jgi:hypothetical protein
MEEWRIKKAEEDRIKNEERIKKDEEERKLNVIIQEYLQTLGETFDTISKENLEEDLVKIFTYVYFEDIF